MVGVKAEEFYAQYMFGNGQQCDMVQKKNGQTTVLMEAGNFQLHSRAIESNRDAMRVP